MQDLGSILCPYRFTVTKTRETHLEAAKMEDLKKGDEVRLKSGGPS